LTMLPAKGRAACRNDSPRLGGPAAGGARQSGAGPERDVPSLGARAFSRLLARNSKEARVQELVQYLLKNLYLDFQGDITMEQIRQFLRQDDSREARRVLARILDEKGVDDLLLTLADCLREHLAHGVNEEVMRNQLNLYAES
jgi:uncharacterized membrane-anchored protein YjiN (DUF445 family)